MFSFKLPEPGPDLDDKVKAFAELNKDREGPLYGLNNKAVNMSHSAWESFVGPNCDGTDACQLKWFWSYPLRERGESSPGAVVGDQVHDAVEWAMRTGVTIRGDGHSDIDTLLDAIDKHARDLGAQAADYAAQVGLFRGKARGAATDKERSYLLANADEARRRSQRFTKMAKVACDIWNKLFAGKAEPVSSKHETWDVIFLRLLPYLPWCRETGEVGFPAPQGWRTEDWLRGVKLSRTGMPVAGKVDQWTKGASQALVATLQDDVGLSIEQGTGLPAITDTKSSSNPRRYGKTSPEDLAAFNQPLMYAGALHVSKYIDASRGVLAQHHYASTKGRPQAFDVWTYLSPQAIDANWERLEDTAIQMQDLMSQVAKTGDASIIPHDTKRCYDYGSCDHAAYCPRHPRNAGKVDSTPMFLAHRPEPVTTPETTTHTNPEIPLSDPRLAALAALGLGNAAESAVSGAAANAAASSPRTNHGSGAAPAAAENPAYTSALANARQCLQHFGGNVPAGLLNNFAAQAGISPDRLLELAKAGDAPPAADETAANEEAFQDAVDAVPADQAAAAAAAAAAVVAAKQVADPEPPAPEPKPDPAATAPSPGAIVLDRTTVADRAQPLVDALLRLNRGEPLADSAIRSAVAAELGADKVHGRTFGAMVKDIVAAGIAMEPTTKAKDAAKRSWNVALFTLVDPPGAPEAPPVPEDQTDEQSLENYEEEAGEREAGPAPVPSTTPAAPSELDAEVVIQKLRDTPPPTNPTGLTLYVGCSPAWGAVSFDSIMGDLYAAVAAKAKVPHWRMAKYDDAKKIAIGELSQAIDNHGVDTVFSNQADVAIPSRHYLADDLVSLLLEKGFNRIVTVG